MKRNINLFLLFFLIVSFQHSHAIDIVKELKELNMHYLELEDFQLNFEIEYVDELGNVVTKRSGEVVHSKKIHFIDLNGNITLINDDQYLSVNKEFETMIYSKWDNTNAPATDVDNLTEMIDSLWQNKGNIDYEVINLSKNKLRVLINENSDPSINAYELLVDINDNKLLEFKYYLKKNDPFGDDPIAEVIIRYTNESSKVKLKGSKYKIAHYIQDKGNELKPTSLFMGYEIISQSQINKEHE
ncbi:MAG: hypothetical protein ACI8ZM_004929 [Crocinitomix sp.]|jgi:hypothetical protein